MVRRTNAFPARSLLTLYSVLYRNPLGLFLREQCCQHRMPCAGCSCANRQVLVHAAQGPVPTVSYGTGRPAQLLRTAIASPSPVDTRGPGSLLLLLLVQLPVLAMNGQLDQAVPVAWARHAARIYKKINPNFHYVEMPNTAHVPTTQSPVANSPTSCGFSLAISFLLSPDYTPSTSCLSEILPVDFEGTSAGVQAVAKEYFGTTDLWGSDS